MPDAAEEQQIDEAVDAVNGEFLTTLTDVAGTLGLTLIGLSHTRTWAEAQVMPGMTEDSMLMMGGNNPNAPEGYSFLRWPALTLPQRLAAQGPVARDVGQQWLITVAAHWNDHFRGRLAEANRIKKSEFKEPGLADITKMRNDVLHHRGVATAANTGRCEIFRWFSSGEEIYPTLGHVVDFMAYMGLLKPTAVENADEHWRVRSSVPPSASSD
jgi:hypothetical protein